LGYKVYKGLLSSIVLACGVRFATTNRGCGCVMESCIVCDKELEVGEMGECKTCRDLLDEKYKGDKTARERSEKFFRWLKSDRRAK